MRTERAEILGVGVDAVTREDLDRFLVATIRRREKAVVLHVNAHALNLATELDWLRRYLNAADLVFCDGAGVLHAARLLGCRIPERITYADWMWRLAELSAGHGFRLFLLGGRPGVASRAAACLTSRVPELEIAGTRHGYFEKANGSPQNEDVIRQINEAGPDILIVGFGMPLQERWLRDNRHRVEAGVALTAGAAFDYVSGAVRRAPDWMTGHSLEWLGRLMIEPRRLWRRYLLGNPLFAWRVVKQRLGGRGGR